MPKWLKLILSLTGTGVCLWYTFRKTDFEAMWISLKSANWFMLIPYLGVLFVIHMARTLRWGNLLSPLEKVPFRALHEASAIGFMMLVILPFRLGEFARPVLIAQRTGIKRSAAMTSVVFERIVDGVTMAALLRGMLLFIPSDKPGIGTIVVGANLMILVFGSGLIFLLVARWQHDFVTKIFNLTLGKMSAGLNEKVLGVVDGFVSALKQVPSRNEFALFFLWTAIYWGINGFGMSMLANAFDCSNANGLTCEPLHINLFEGFVVLGVLIIGMMIPAAPGSAGTFQAFILLALGVFVSNSVVNSSGVAYANLMWLVQMGQQILTGLYFMLRSHLSFRDIASNMQAPTQEGARS
jgi:glycosyltransferase 2 family protein